jgi:hypothetical protein
MTVVMRSTGAVLVRVAWRWLWVSYAVNMYLVGVTGFKRHGKHSHPIVTENKLPGTKSWWHPAAKEIPQVLSGFTTRFSVDPGQTVEFKVNNSGWTVFNISVYRLGYYGGMGGRLIHASSVRQEFAQPRCRFDFDTRMTDCNNWRISYAWKVPLDAVTGIYVGVVDHFDVESHEHFFGHYMPFVVRLQFNVSTSFFASDILFKTSDTTWVAYNKFGGWNIYRGNGSFTFDSRAFMASYNRPFSNRLPKLMGGQHQNFLFGTEFATLYWLERHGYDVSYASCSDVELYYRHSILSGRYHVLFSVGHDEYWSNELRLAYEHARESGISLAFLSGNEIFWKIRWGNSFDNIAGNKSVQHQQERRFVILEHHFNMTDDKTVTLIAAKLHVDEARQNRILICSKETIDGSQKFSSPEDWTGTFIDPRFRPPVHINSLTGQYFEVNGFRHDSIVVTAGDAGMRFWRNTELSNITSGNYTFPGGYLGYEWDTFRDDCFLPLGIFALSTTTLDVSGFRMEEYGASYKGAGILTHRMTLYRHISNITVLAHHAPKTALVFGAGTVQWVWGLSDWHDSDFFVPENHNIQQATVNVLADMNVMPSLLDRGADPPLKLAFPSRDIEPPMSSILYPVSLSNVTVNGSASTWLLNISGTAKDAGGGEVAGVQVSVDGGETWHIANGRSDWHYVHSFGTEHQCESPQDNIRADPNISRKGQFNSSNMLHIVSRSVDDSGWVESCNSTFHHADKLRHRSNVRVHNHRFSHSKCSVPSAISTEDHASNNIVIFVAFLET